MKSLYNLLKIIRTSLVVLYGCKELRTIVNRYLLYFSQIRKENGLPFAIKHFKVIRLHITRYICGKPLYINSDLVSVKYGFPSRFLDLKRFIDRNRFNQRKMMAVMMLICFSRAIVPTKVENNKRPFRYSVASIVNGNKKKPYTIPKEFINRFILVNRFRGYYKVDIQKDAYFSMKSSPFGLSIVSTWYSILGLPYSLIQSIINLTGNDYRIDHIYNFSFKNYELLKEKKLVKVSQPGKLALVFDAELKVRVIAMLDYYSQLVLKPIHSHLLKCLESLDCDRTFTQDPKFSVPLDPNHQIWSLDLSSATDRFPVILQKKVIRAIFGHNIAEDWYNLLVNRLYARPGHICSGTEAQEDNFVSYAVGQPMGAYSSWAAFTLTHHLCVHWCAHLEGFDLMSFKNYIILGDDIVINHDGVAKRYTKLMNKLGVEVSASKTHVSKDTYEFAKRWILSGQEITGLPLRGVFKNLNHPKRAYTIIFDYIRKTGLFCSPKLFTSLVYNGLSISRKGRRFSLRSFEKYIYHYDKAVRFKHGLMTMNELRSYLADLNPKIELPEDLIPLMRGSLFNGSLRVINNNVNSLLSIKTVYIDNIFGDAIDLNDLWCFPIINSIYNFISNCLDVINNIQDDEDPEEILAALSGICLPDTDKLVLAFRDVKTRVATLDKVWMNSIHLIKSYDPDNIFFGSSYQKDISWWNPSGNRSVMVTNLTFIQNSILPIINQSVVKYSNPYESISSYEDKWSKFFDTTNDDQ